MKILQEFKEFAMRGNVVDLAVGVIIGGAFGKIVTSVVNDVIMPPIGVVLGGVDFKNLYIPLKPIPEDKTVATLEQAAANNIPVIAYGQFVNVILDFLIVAACVFLLVKGINFLREARKHEEAAPATPAEKECPYCLSQVPIKATRCKYCTSKLEGANAETGHAHG